jgi:hypothetical protein
MAVVLLSAENSDRVPPADWIRITTDNMQQLGCNSKHYLRKSPLFTRVLEDMVRQALFDSDTEVYLSISGNGLHVGTYIHPLLFEVLEEAASKQAAHGLDRCVTLAVNAAKQRLHQFVGAPLSAAAAESQPPVFVTPVVRRPPPPPISVSKRKPEDDVEHLRQRCQKAAEFAKKMGSIDGIKADVVASMAAKAQAKLDEEAERLYAAFIDDL